MRVQAYLLALLVCVLDQISKYWILEIVKLPERGFVDLLPFFRLTFVGNVGVSMGLFSADSDAGRWLLVALTAGIACVVVWWIASEKHKPEILSLGLVLGGALGNIIDRVRFGYVVDFLHFFWGERSFWVFNVADAAITCGVLVLLVRALRPAKG